MVIWFISSLLSLYFFPFRSFEYLWNFKEPGCKLLDLFYFGSASKILGPLRRASSIFNEGHWWPRLGTWTVPHVSVVLLTWASCGPTVKILTGVALVPGGGWVLKDGFQC